MDRKLSQSKSSTHHFRASANSQQQPRPICKSSNQQQPTQIDHGRKTDSSLHLLPPDSSRCPTHAPDSSHLGCSAVTKIPATSRKPSRQFKCRVCELWFYDNGGFDRNHISRVKCKDIYIIFCIKL